MIYAKTMQTGHRRGPAFVLPDAANSCKVTKKLRVTGGGWIVFCKFAK